MAKRLDNDSTMEVSSSQLVGDGKNRPAPHRQPGQDKNDVSMWIGGVVGADAFAGTAKPKKGGRGLLVALILLIVAAGAGASYFLVLKPGSKPSPSAGSAAAPLPAAPTMDAQPAVVPAATPDAAPADAGVDAAADAGPLKADAISGLPEKPADSKKPATKKPAVKKPATKTVKKPAPKKHH